MRQFVLWGQHWDEYRELFALSPQDSSCRLLEFGCGPNAVNAELKEQGCSMVSCDSLFNLDSEALLAEVWPIFKTVLDKMNAEKDHLDLRAYGSLEALKEKRQAGLEQFFADYSLGKEEGRYLGSEGVSLGFPDFSFDLALSTNFLFRNFEMQDLDFHVAMIKELVRVAREVRIAPLVDKSCKPSPLLGPVLLALQEANLGVEVKNVEHPLQPNGNAMLRVWAQECKL